MAIRKFLVIPVILLLFCITAKAEGQKIPYYTAEGKYNAEEHTYKVDVYLTTDDYLAAGTFGMEFDDTISPTWHDGTAEGENTGYLQIDKAYFTLLEPAPFKAARESLKGKKYIVAMWGLNETDVKNPVRGRLHLGTITIPDVTMNTESYPDDWTDKPFRLLNWNKTDLAKDDLFTRIDDYYETGTSINSEIWRDITAAEKTALGTNAPEGYYQGFIFDTEGNSKQTDIDFKFISGLEQPDMVITGTVQGYNPKNTVQITAYGNNGDAYTAEITGFAIKADGEITCDYEIKIPKSGEYTLVYEKQAHLTYAAKIIATEKTTEIPDTLKLICGDINGDGYIKYPDRACLTRFLNRCGKENSKADLNGDGFVNLFDLNILKTNLDKTY